MGRVGDPSAEALIQFVVDRDHVGCIRLVMCCGDDAAFDPVMDDIETDTVSFLHLPNVEASFGRARGRNVVFVS